jgi:hypothetical protein
MSNLPPTVEITDHVALSDWHAQQRDESHEAAPADVLAGVTATDACAALLQHILSPVIESGLSPASPRLIGLRAIAVANLLGVAGIGDLGAAGVARKIKVTRALISWHQVNFADQVGVHFRTQRRTEARDHYREARQAAINKGFAATRNPDWDTEI